MAENKTKKTNFHVLNDQTTYVYFQISFSSIPCFDIYIYIYRLEFVYAHHMIALFWNSFFSSYWNEEIEIGANKFAEKHWNTIIRIIGGCELKKFIIFFFGGIVRQRDEEEVFLLLLLLNWKWFNQWWDFYFVFFFFKRCQWTLTDTQRRCRFLCMMVKRVLSE